MGAVGTLELVAARVRQLGDRSLAAVDRRVAGLAARDLCQIATVGDAVLGIGLRHRAFDRLW